MYLKIDLTTPPKHPRSQMPEAISSAANYEIGLSTLLKTTTRIQPRIEHSFVIEGTSSELYVWLDLFKELYPATEQEVNAIKKAIRLNVVYGKDDVIRLADLTRQHPHEGTLVSRPWFWTYDNR